MTQEEKTKKVARAEQRLRQAQAEYKKALREEKEREQIISEMKKMALN